MSSRIRGWAAPIEQISTGRAATGLTSFHRGRSGLADPTRNGPWEGKLVEAATCVQEEAVVLEPRGRNGLVVVAHLVERCGDLGVRPGEVEPSRRSRRSFCEMLLISAEAHATDEGAPVFVMAPNDPIRWTYHLTPEGPRDRMPSCQSRLLQSQVTPPGTPTATRGWSRTPTRSCGANIGPPAGTSSTGSPTRRRLRPGTKPGEAPARRTSRVGAP